MTASARPSLAQLLSLAWPVVVSRSTQVVVGFTDAAMVAQLGEAELAATTTGALNTLSLFDRWHVSVSRDYYLNTSAHRFNVDLREDSKIQAS